MSSNMQNTNNTQMPDSQGNGGPLSVMPGFGNTTQDFGIKARSAVGGAGSSMKINGSRVKVAVRIRPLLPTEVNQGHQSTSLRVSENNHQVTIQPGSDDTNGGNQSQRARTFQFDQVFSQYRDQQQVYESLGIAKLINRVVDGYHGTIFAYGQTGSGKTYTMEGSDARGINSQQKKEIPDGNDWEGMGITQRGVHELFDRINSIKKTETTRHFSVFVSFLQIYNEKVYDLLNISTAQGGGLPNKRTSGVGNSNSLDGQAGLRIRWTKKDQFVVENLYVFETSSASEVLDLYRYGARNRVLAAHKMNDLSSRSHSIFTITIESQDLRDPVNVTISKLQLVDLAGSEKQSQTGTTGKQAKESIDINKSLHVLRKVITALTDTKKQSNNNSFVPYRESKLTCLLKQSLGGNSYTLMVACLSPSDRYFEENLSTLNYASKASQISNLPTKNIDPKLLIMNDQKKKIIDLDAELKNANIHIQNLSQLNREKETIIEKLNKKLVKQVQINQQNQQRYVEGASPTSPRTRNLNATQFTDASRSMLPSIAGQQRDSKIGNGLNESREGDRSQSPPKQMNQSQATQFRMTMTGTGFHDKQKQEAQAERLIHSVNAVTDLLKANTELREGVEHVQRNFESKDAENTQLHIENQQLRERVELVENILKNNSTQLDDMLSSSVKTNVEKSNTEYGRFTGYRSTAKKDKDSPDEDAGEEGPLTVDEVYNELIHLRKMNRTLGDRIKHLEVQNFRMTAQGFNKNGKTKHEPTRPMFGENNNNYENDSNEGGRISRTEDGRAKRTFQTPVHRLVSAEEQNSGEVVRANYTELEHEYRKAHHNTTGFKHQTQKNSMHQTQYAVKDSQTLLPRPHHQHTVNGNTSEYMMESKIPRGYQSDLPERVFKASRDSINEQEDKQSYQPVPDGRFYTKANFFTLADRQEAGFFSSGDDLLENQPKQNRNTMQTMQPSFGKDYHHKGTSFGNQDGAAVPFPQAAAQSYQGGEPFEKRKLRDSYQTDAEAQYVHQQQQYEQETRHSKFTLQPISEKGGPSQKPQRHSMMPPPYSQSHTLNQRQPRMPQHSNSMVRSGVSSSKRAKKSTLSVKQSNINNNSSDLSMVLVMSNLIQKRKQGVAKGGGQKRGGSSNATSYKPGTKVVQNEFYF